MTAIQNLHALEILDSRGRPTVRVTCVLESGASGTVSVPSGASTGAAEALELRDGDKDRYGGLGCRKAVGHVNVELNQSLRGVEGEQHEIDQRMIELDGTPNKSRLGANAMLAVSLAFARARANEREVPLYDAFSDVLGERPQSLPRPTINLFSGGKHAGGQIPIQDVLVVPSSIDTIDDALAATYAVYQAAGELSWRKYGSRPLTADEGGLAPPFPDADAMLTDAVEAIEAAGLKPGQDVVLAVDVASSHFYQDGVYRLNGAGLNSESMIEVVEGWLRSYPIVSLEDALAEDDWQAWPQLTETVGDRALVLGDDFLCTNTSRIQRAIETNAANALLLKVNQIGTLSEAADACRMARSAGWRVTISARSGETEDDWLADLAVGWSGDQIKVGSITQSERLAKYNRLLAIEQATTLPMVAWPG